MIFDEYEKDKYRRFAETVDSILNTALRAEGDAYHLWGIQHREKSTDSLRDKLTDRGLLDHPNIENEIKDLAGCRIIFYSNDDVNNFLRSGIVHENFDIDRGRSKIHQPVEETEDATELYRAHHFLVSLKDSRTDLAKYSEFSGLKCEIQIQTILNHAWSETGHDVIYKTPKLIDFGTKQHDEIKERMAKIMKQHLLPAGYEFQKVLHDFERLTKGQDLFDRNVLESIENAVDNNERFETLERFREHVLPNYDDLSAVCQEILQIVSRAIELSKKTEQKPIITPSGDFDGKHHDDISEVALEIIEYIRYVDPQVIFSKLCEIYLSSNSEKEKKKILEVVNSLSEHNLDVWKKVGPHIQSLLIQQLQGFDDGVLDKLRPIVIEVCKETLDPELEGTSSNYKTFTFRFGPVIVSEELRNVRYEAIELLQRLYTLSNQEKDKRELMNAMDHAFRQPSRGEYPDELLVMILEDSCSIIEFYESVAKSEQFEILQHLEYNLLGEYRIKKQWIEGNKISVEAKIACEKLISAIEKYRDCINKDDNFVKYKTLVGFESAFPQSWENEDFELEEQDTYRAQKISEYVDSINEENADDWFEFIQRCTRTDSLNLATFPSFTKFLRLLSERRPSIALNYLDAINDTLTYFLPAFLGGLWKSSKKDDLQVRINDWTEKHQYLLSIVRHYKNEGLVDERLFKHALYASIRANNADAVNEAIVACIEHHNEANSATVLELFFQALTFLTEICNTSWTREVGFQAHKCSLFDVLDSGQVKIILSNLIHVPRITHHEERVLSTIAKNYPEEVIEYFGERVQYEITQDTKKKKNLSYWGQYEAIPYNFHYLSESLSEFPKQSTLIVREWYSQSSELFTFRGGKLLTNIFPKITKEIQAELISIINSKNLDDIDFTLEVLKNYKGESFLHTICKEILIALPNNDDERSKEVEFILNSTDVVAGAFGFVEAYKTKKEEIIPWLNDENKRVRNFSEKYIANLDHQIASDHRSAEQDLELRKRNCGDEDSE